MKNNRILTILTTFLIVAAIIMYSIPVYIFLKNYSLNYYKEVYIGGDNIVLDYVANTDDNTITTTNEYATIGTITYIDLEGNYGAIGHELNINSFKKGNIFITPVESVIKSIPGKVGEKNVNLGFFNPNGSIDNIQKNGVYGKFTENVTNKDKFVVGMPKEIKKSDALLYTNIDGTEVKAYKIKIEKLYLFRQVRNIYIKIVDEELLEKTGGVIQGMSGSPIVQDGKIIGSLSHVDDKNPIYGYCLLITNMI